MFDKSRIQDYVRTALYISLELLHKFLLGEKREFRRHFCCDLDTAAHEPVYSHVSHSVSERYGTLTKRHIMASGSGRKKKLFASSVLSIKSFIQMIKYTFSLSVVVAKLV